MSKYEELCKKLPTNPKVWLVTGVAGFIGSNLLETLLKLDQQVVGLDNFATGHQKNLDEVKKLTTSDQWSRFKFIKGDIRDLGTCQMACAGVDYVLHQAALGSVPRSIENPIATNETNISGFLNMLVAAHSAKVTSFTYAASSSTYGDHPALPKLEENIGKPLSPYAVTKYVNELYAEVFARCFNFNTIGLRYFNVFGPRQDPNGAYAAVIPKWIDAMIKRELIFINGDGETSRDFCFVANAIQANLLSVSNENLDAKNQIYNVAVGDRTSLNDLFKLLGDSLEKYGVCYNLSPQFRDFRAGDVKHSQASITKISELLGYEPTHNIKSGILETIKWYSKMLSNSIIS